MFSRDARLGPFQRLAGVPEERLDTPVRVPMRPGVISIAEDGLVECDRELTRARDHVAPEGVVTDLDILVVLSR